MIGFNYLGKLGQLGNQMFQYATVMGVAKNIGTSYCIPNHDEVFDDGIGNKLRIELFNAFDINPERTGFVPGPNIQEKDFTFDPSLFEIPSDHDASLVGFFQTQRYFEHIADDVRKEFKFRQHIINDCKEIIEEVFEDPIALHIRRGDYLINSDNHHNLSLEYYKQALKKFSRKRQVIIFTDDPEWASKQKLFKSDRFVVSEGTGSYHDLYLMTQCSDFIIANSTYSWWGAWLANHGRVIAPARWFGPNNQHKSLKDLYPFHWEILDYD